MNNIFGSYLYQALILLLISLVNFLPITVKSKERMLAASQVVDKANG